MTHLQPKSFHGVPLVALPPDVSRILFVGNLDSSVTGETLYRVFHKFGALRQVRISNTPETAGTAFVIFESVFDAQRAQEHLNGFAVAKGAKSLLVRFYDEKRHLQVAERKRRRREQLEQLNQRQQALAASAAAVVKQQEGED